MVTTVTFQLLGRGAGAGGAEAEAVPARQSVAEPPVVLPGPVRCPAP